MERTRKLSLKRKRISDAERQGCSRNKKESLDTTSSVSKPSASIPPPPVVTSPWQHLPSLPPWTNVEVKGVQDQKVQSKPIEIAVTEDVTMQWSPFPPFCKKCLIRRRPKKAAEQGQNMTKSKQTKTANSSHSGVIGGNNVATAFSEDNKLQTCAGSVHHETIIANKQVPQLQMECTDDSKHLKTRENVLPKKEFRDANQNPLSTNSFMTVTSKTDITNKVTTVSSITKPDIGKNRSKPTSMNTKLVQNTGMAKTQLTKSTNSTGAALQSKFGSGCRGDLTTRLKPNKRMGLSFEPLDVKGGVIEDEMKTQKETLHSGLDSVNKSNVTRDYTSGIKQSLGSSKKACKIDTHSRSTQIHHAKNEHRQNSYASRDGASLPNQGKQEGYVSLTTAAATADAKTQHENSKKQNITTSACNTAAAAMNHGKDANASISLATVANEALGGLSEEELIILLSSDEEEDVKEMVDVPVVKSVPVRSSWKPSSGNKSRKETSRSSQSAKGTKPNQLKPTNSIKTKKTGGNSSKSTVNPPNMRTLFHYAKPSVSPSTSTSNLSPSNKKPTTHAGGNSNQTSKHFASHSNRMSAGQSSMTNMKSADKSSAGEKSGLQSCPMCQLTFKAGWSQVQIDGHIAACLAESTEDVFW